MDDEAASAPPTQDPIRMRIHGIILSFGVLALLPVLAWPAAAVKKKKQVSRSPIVAATKSEETRSTVSKPAPKVSSADSTLRRAPAAPLRDPEEKDTLAGDMPAKDSIAEDSLSGIPKPVFAWGMGTSHTRGLYRAGAWQPDGWRGVGGENRYWTYQTYARQSWPLSIRGQSLIVAANVDQSTAGEFSTLDAALEAQIPEGILADLALALSGGLRKSREWGSYRSYDLQVSKAWYSETVGLGLQAGFSREWNQKGKRLYDNAWVGLHRDIRFRSGNSLGFDLLGAVETRDPQYDWITASVLYVDDVSKPQPTHFRAPDFRDTLPGNAGDAFRLYGEHAGALQLAMVAPRSFFSLRPSLQYGISLPAGFGAMAGARYALDLYRESAWDWVPAPDSLDLSQADLVALAYNRADGRYYAAALVEEGGEVREAYGGRPMQHRRAKRMDQRAGMNLGVWRDMPQGYSLAVEASAELAWSNLSHASPIGSQPWQWGLTFNLGRYSNR